jgi:uncharacterized membrane protein
VVAVVVVVAVTLLLAQLAVQELLFLNTLTLELQLLAVELHNQQQLAVDLKFQQ